MRGSMVFFFQESGYILNLHPGRSLQKGGGVNICLYTSYKLIIFTSHQSYFLYRYIFFEKY